MRWSSWLKIAAAGLLAAALLWLASLDGALALFDPDRVRELLAGAGALAPVLLVAVIALAVVVSPIPGAPLNAAGGAFFGTGLGTLYAAIGGLLGATLAFGIGRLLGRELVERLVGGHISFCATCSDRALTWVVFASRLVPFLSFDVVSYGAGLTKMSLTRFALATFAGMLPLTFGYTYLGSTLRFSSPTVLVGGAGMVALFLALPRWIERYDLFGLRRFFASHLDAETR